MLKYKGSQQFRQRILLATLSGRPVRIDGIRENHEQVGLRDFEASFLRLLEKVVNGCEIVINETGTGIRYRPGIITGGADLSHDCGTSRGISYFLQPLLVLAPFAKAPLSITLKGITNSEQDIGVDVIRTVTMPMLRHFGIGESAGLVINKRGAPPLGGGEVVLPLPIVRELTPVKLVDFTMVKRVRGIAYGTKVSPQVPAPPTSRRLPLLPFATRDSRPPVPPRRHRHRRLTSAPVALRSPIGWSTRRAAS